MVLHRLSIGARRTRDAEVSNLGQLNKKRFSAELQISNRIRSAELHRHDPWPKRYVLAVPWTLSETNCCLP